MITVEEAKELLFNQVQKSESVEVSIAEAFGGVLSDDIFSPLDLPSFNQSSMDGYAVADNDTGSYKQFEVIGEIKAGDNFSLKLLPGQAVRIFTGAVVPLSADAVVIQEKVERRNGFIYLSEEINKGAFIRLKGSQIKRGELALKKDSVLNPASVGFLASLGFTKVKIYSKPTVSILVTGDEIVLPGSNLQPGQVYESNSFSLHAALQQMHIQPENILRSPDDKNKLKERIEKCLADADITIITGGISVGEYDLVQDVLNELKIETIFYKVAQKPGKPLFAGKIENKLVVALPGNPASAMVCFYEYVYPVIRKMRGFEKTTLTNLNLNLLNDIIKKEERSLFIRAKTMNQNVMPLEGQDSYMLRSFAEADAFIYIPKEQKQINKGDAVEVHLLPVIF